MPTKPRSQPPAAFRRKSTNTNPAASSPSSPALSHPELAPSEEDTIHERKYVRFLISPPSPPPENEMTDSGPRRSTRIAQGPAQIVTTTDPTSEKKKFGPVNKWGKQELDWLHVKFIKEEFDLNEIPGFGGNLSPQFQSAIEKGARQLAAFSLDEIRRGIDPDDLDEYAPHFRNTFIGLGHAMIKDETKLIERRARLEERAAQRPSTIVPTSSSMQEEPRTPDQSTHPNDPHYSGSSAESKSEGPPNMLIFDFVRDCAFSLGRVFRNVPWPQSQNPVKIGFFQQIRTKFQLGNKNISAINDGGLVIMYVQNNITSMWKYKGCPPILGIEAKRMSAKKRADPNFKYWYTAQVFGEMLGQVCFDDFFANPNMTYQEAFVIHIVHTTLYFYYCKFPKRYLAEIAKYGSKFSELQDITRGVKLRRTKSFHMRETSERIELYKLIAYLWRYLASGVSHVGYLHNYPQNPIHQIGQVMEAGGWRAHSIDLSNIEDDYEYDDEEREGELEWEYESDYVTSDEDGSEGESSGSLESSGSSYSPSLTGLMMETDS